MDSPYLKRSAQSTTGQDDVVNGKSDLNEMVNPNSLPNHYSNYSLLALRMYVFLVVRII